MLEEMTIELYRADRSGRKVQRGASAAGIVWAIGSKTFGLRGPISCLPLRRLNRRITAPAGKEVAPASGGNYSIYMFADGLILNFSGFGSLPVAIAPAAATTFFMKPRRFIQAKYYLKNRTSPLAKSVKVLRIRNARSWVGPE